MVAVTASRSRALSISVALFVTWGALLAISGGLGAGFVASFMHKRFILMSGRTDALLFGQSIPKLYTADPALEQSVVMHLTMLSAVLGSVGIATATLAWVGLRRGSRAALGGLILTPTPIAAWFIAIVSQYRARGISVALADMPPFVWVGVLVAVVGGIFGWQGLRR